jgi:phosphate transport system substrate-binding protein
MTKKNVVPIIILSVIVLGSIPVPVAFSAETINGAGASFPYPLYSQWSYKYNQITGMELNYQSIGSGGGIQQIKARTVDFGASDAPLKAEELDRFGMIQFPMVIGGVVPVVHLEGIESGQLKLSADVIVKIFLGEINKWNHPMIKTLNSDLNLPNKDITVVHRADGSGTTWIFTHYLTTVSEEWKRKVGASKAVSWPAGVGGKGNEGVASYVKRINGSIGYVEFAYAVQNQLTYILLQNHDGNYVAPTKESFMAAAANADWENAPGFYLVLVDQSGANSWPITGVSFILIYKEQSEPDRASAMLEFFYWCFKHGRQIAFDLDYVPMPDNVVDIVQSVWRDHVQSDGKHLWH